MQVCVVDLILLLCYTYMLFLLGTYQVETNPSVQIMETSI
jgi:hypothetical protein